MKIKRICATAAGSVVVMASLQVLGTPSALAASSHASCLAHESSSISPPGTSDEFPGGRAELSHVIKELGGELGVSPGAIISSVAHLHEGSHEACDEATE